MSGRRIFGPDPANRPVFLRLFKPVVSAMGYGDLVLLAAFLDAHSFSLYCSSGLITCFFSQLPGGVWFMLSWDNQDSERVLELSHICMRFLILKVDFVTSARIEVSVHL